jgi:hypothetical protein
MHGSKENEREGRTRGGRGAQAPGAAAERENPLVHLAEVRGVLGGVTCCVNMITSLQGFVCAIHYAEFATVVSCHTMAVLVLEQHGMQTYFATCQGAQVCLSC